MPTVALVVAQFYEDIADVMEDRATRTLAAADATLGPVVSVPGVYDTPLAADRLARRADVDAVTVLGAVITGDTDHDQVVTHTAARHLAQIGLDRDTPVTFGVTGPDMTVAHAHDRIANAAAAVTAALDLLDALPEPT